MRDDDKCDSQRATTFDIGTERQSDAWDRAIAVIEPCHAELSYGQKPLRSLHGDGEAVPPGTRYWMR